MVRVSCGVLTPVALVICMFLPGDGCADVVQVGQINSPLVVAVVGLKVGYEIGKGFFLGPEAGISYVHGAVSTTDPFAGITLGYKRIFSVSRNESDAYLDLCIGAISEPSIVYGGSAGVNFSLQYGRLPSVFFGESSGRWGYKLSAFGGWATTMDVTLTVAGAPGSVGIGQKFALPLLIAPRL